MKTKASQQLIALILTAVSVLMLFFPWISLSGQAGKDFRKAVKEAKKYGSAASEVVEDELGSILSFVPQKAKKQASRMIKAFSDGRLSASETVSVTRTLSSVVKAVKNSYLFGFMDKSTQSGLKTAGFFLGLYPWLFWATLLLGLATVALPFVYDGKTRVGMIYAVFQCVMLLAFIILCIILRGTSESLIGEKLSFRITLFSLLAPALAFFAGPLSGRIAGLLPASAGNAAPAVRSAPAGRHSAAGKHSSAGRQGAHAAGAAGWRCSCGKLNAAASTFCGACGEPKPAPRICPQCGREVLPGKAFCGKCGAKLDE